MNKLSHDFVTVDMRGLKAALATRARALQVSVSVLVRGAVERELGLDAIQLPPLANDPATPGSASIVKVSLRLTAADAARLASDSLHAGLPRGAYVASLLGGAGPHYEGSATRKECVAAVVASGAEMSTLSRNLHHLTLLLRDGNVQAASEYRAMLGTLGDDVRAHLRLAASLLAELRQRLPGRAAGSTAQA